MDLISRIFHLEIVLLTELHRYIASHEDLWTLAVALRTPETWVPLYAGIFLYLGFRRGWKTSFLLWGAGSLLLFGMSEMLTVHILKPVVGRIRPCHDPDLLPLLEDSSLCGGLWSFPSTHATTHMGLAVFWSIFFRNFWIRFVWILWAVGIGLAQVAVAVHYPTDVLTGWFLGILLGGFLRRGITRMFPEWVHPKRPEEIHR